MCSPVHPIEIPYLQYARCAKHWHWFVILTCNHLAYNRNQFRDQKPWVGVRWSSLPNVLDIRVRDAWSRHPANPKTISFRIRRTRRKSAQCYFPSNIAFMQKICMLAYGTDGVHFENGLMYAHIWGRRQQQRVCRCELYGCEFKSTPWSVGSQSTWACSPHVIFTDEHTHNADSHMHGNREHQ